MSKPRLLQVVVTKWDSKFAFGVYMYQVDDIIVNVLAYLAGNIYTEPVLQPTHPLPLPLLISHVSPPIKHREGIHQ